MDDEALALVALGADVWVAGSVDATAFVETEVDHHAPPAAAGPAWATSAPQISAHTACKRTVGNASNATSYSTCVSRIGSSQPSHGWPTPNPAQYLTGGRSGRTPAVNFRSMVFFIGRPAFLFSCNSGIASYAAGLRDVKWPEHRLSVYLSRSSGFSSGAW